MPVSRQQFALGIVNMDAVCRNGLIAQNAEIVQPGDGALTGPAQAVFLVGLMFGNMDVKAGTVRQASAQARQRLVAECQAGVQPERPRRFAGALLASMKRTFSAMPASAFSLPSRSVTS